jgi:DNA-binding SARP family transcriptional activator
MIRSTMSIVQDSPSAVIELRLHGYPSVSVDGRAVPLALKHAFALIARLADARGRLSRASAAALLWPDAPEAVGRSRLRRLVHELNRRLRLAWVAGDADSLWLDAQAAEVQCDWLQERRLGRRVLRGDAMPPTQAAPLLDAQADRLLDGFALGADAYDEWLDATRREHAALVARALLELALRWIHEGEPVAAQVAAERLVRLDPCNEMAHACVITARAERGDAAGVETAYFECAAALRQELGIRPSALLERAYAAAVARCRDADDAVLNRLLARLAPAHPAGRTLAGRRGPTITPSPIPTDLC